MPRTAASPSKSKACKAGTSAPNWRAAWSTPVGISANSAPSASAWRISSCNSPPPNPKKTPRKKEARSEKHTPHLQERAQELFRIAHRLRRDGAFCADLRLAFLRLHPLLFQHEHAGDDAAAAYERERRHHPSDAWF